MRPSAYSGPSSTIIPVLLALLGQYTSLLTGLQGPAQKSPFHCCFLWFHFYAELDFFSSLSYSTLFTTCFRLPCSNASPSGQDTLSTVPTTQGGRAPPLLVKAWGWPGAVTEELMKKWLTRRKGMELRWFKPTPLIPTAGSSRGVCRGERLYPHITQSTSIARRWPSLSI